MALASKSTLIFWKATEIFHTADLSIDLAFLELFVPDGRLTNPAPTAQLAFLRLNISVLESERPHQRPQDSKLPLQLSQRGIGFRNVGRKPRSEQGHQKGGEERAAPNLVSAGIFQTHLSSVASRNPPKTVHFSFSQTSQRRSDLYPKRGRMPSSRPAAAGLGRERGRQYIFLLQFCSGRCSPRGPASRRNSGLAGELSINHPGECLGQQGENSHSFPRDHTTATECDVCANKSSAASCLQGSFVCSCMLKNSPLLLHTGLC